uniref:DsbA family protein n=1 Tax=Raoultella sp. 18093 TaxID=2681425 RepID=UPI00190F33DE
MKHIVFYLDFVSPYAWLAFERLPQVLEGLSHSVEYRPVLLGALLQQHGNPVAHELPGVGSNLQDHLQIRAVFKVNGVPTLNTLAGNLWGRARIGLEYALKRSGPMSMAPSQLGAFTRSAPGQPHPNIQY